MDSAEERLLGEIASENAIDVPERHEPVMVAVADLLVGDDVDVNYAGSGEYFPGRLLELDITGEIPVATVKLHTRHVCERVPISLLRSRTSDTEERSRLSRRQRAMRVNGAENWLLLGQGEGAANAEWQRQVERIRVLDGLGGDVEDESACVRSYAARISARELGDGSLSGGGTRQWAVNAAEMDALLTSSKYRTDRISVSDGGGVAMPRSDRAKHRIVVVGRDGNEPPLFLFRDSDGRVVEWTQTQVDEYLRVAWKHDWDQRIESGDAQDVAVRVMISLNKRSSKAALKPNAEHRDEALAAIEQEGDQFVANRVLSAPMTYAEIPVEHRTNILKVFQFVVDKHDASGVFVKCKARSVADGSAQVPGTYGESTAPVMSALACKLLLAMAATLGMKIASIDIATAFCLTPNPYEVYLELPDALEKRFGKYVRMLKCVYGTRQAAHQFYMMMRGGLERAGYEACDDDAGLFRKVKPDGSFVLIGLHVDDSLIVYNSDEELQDIVNAHESSI